MTALEVSKYFYTNRKSDDTQNVFVKVAMQFVHLLVESFQ